MFSFSDKYLRIASLSMGLILLLGSLLVGAMNKNSADTADDECIHCHVATFNQGISSRYFHVPFWDRKCVVCHLPKGTERLAVKTSADQPFLTGEAVTQDKLWRKARIYSMAPEPVFEQLIAVPDLGKGTAYRFRLVLSPVGLETDNQAVKSPWLGLKPNEIDDLGQDGALSVEVWSDRPFADLTKEVVLYRNGSHVFLTWRTTQPLYGWIEIQELEGLDLVGLSAETAASPETSTEDEHPPLRDPESLAIEACYECHAASELGTSHPVRLYSGRNVKIPDDLPTVDGMLTCVTCHDPHGSEGKMLVRTVIKTKLCVTCHINFKNRSLSTMFN